MKIKHFYQDAQCNDNNNNNNNNNICVLDVPYIYI
jgi:hypothetical protein